MSTTFKIKYVYANILEDNDCLKDYNIHQVSDHIISEHLAKKDCSAGVIIDKKFLIDVLKNDGAYFYYDSMRYFDGQQKVFLQLDSAFMLDISNRETKELLLWIKGVNKHNKKQLKTMNQRLREVEKYIGSLKKSTTAQTSNTTLPLRELPALTTELRSDETISRGKAPLLARRAQSLMYPELETGSSSPRSLGRPLETQKIDIAIMYAEPLVKREGDQIFSQPDAVDYEEECNQIYEVLDSKKMKIDLVIEIASRDNLVSVLNKGPKILHIMCHGEFDRIKQQFYLCFENNEGELDPFYADDLRAILQRLKPDIQLVFVNACHSEQVARVFADAGVPCVIAVQSQLQIADMVARNFAQKIYEYLFDGCSIGQAFQASRLAIQTPNALSCCCAHKHKPNCQWARKAQIEGFYKAHLYHDPSCTSCPRKTEHIHLMTCDWAEKFVHTYSSLEDDDIEKWYDYEHEEMHTCCCSPELPHDETMKFLKIPEHSSQLDNLVLFKDRQEGRLVNRKPFSILDQVFPVKRLIGRNRPMYELFRALRSKQRFIELQGVEGVGKSSLIKQLANYLYARDLFRCKIAIIYMEKIDSISFFLPELYKEIDFAYDFKSFCQALKNREALFILEKCDSILEKNKRDFIDILKDIAEMTKHVKFVLITNQKIDLNLGETIITLGDLPRVDAAKLLLISTSLENLPSRYRNIEELKESKLFVEFKSFSPQTIWWLSQKLNQKEDFFKIEREMLDKLKHDRDRATQIELTIGSVLE